MTRVVVKGVAGPFNGRRGGFMAKMVRKKVVLVVDVVGEHPVEDGILPVAVKRCALALVQAMTVSGADDHFELR